MDLQPYLKIIPGHDGTLEEREDVDAMEFEEYCPLQNDLMLVLENNGIEMKFEDFDGGPFMGYSGWKEESGISRDMHTTLTSSSHTDLHYSNMNSDYSESALNFDGYGMLRDSNGQVVEQLETQPYTGDTVVGELVDVKPVKLKLEMSSLPIQMEVNGTVKPENCKRGPGRPRGSRNKPGGNIKAAKANGAKRGRPSKKAAVEEVTEARNLMDMDIEDIPEPIPLEYLKIKPKQHKSKKKAATLNEQETANYQEKRLKNTLSAKKCREKLKINSDKMKSRLRHLEPAYQKLKSDNEKLREENLKLREKLTSM